MENLIHKHHNNLDFLRLVLALLVIFTHSYVVYDGNTKAEPFIIFSYNKVTFGNVAVNFFFVISGYLVLQSLLRSRNGFDFFKKRVLRIYPAFALVCLFTVFLFVPFGNSHYSDSLGAYIKYLKQVDFNYLPQTILRLKPPYLPESFINQPAPYEVNFSLWTIPIEFFCYLLLLGFGILGMARNKWLMLLITLLSIGNMAYFKYGDISWLNKFFKQDFLEQINATSGLLPFFMAGVSFYHFEKYLPKKTSVALACLLITVISARFTNAFFFFQLIPGSYFLFWLGFNENIRLSTFTRYGDFSYGVYLFGCPVQQLVMYYAGGELNVYGILFVSILLVMVFAVFSWFVIEKPFLKLKKINSLFGIKLAKPGV